MSDRTPTTRLEAATQAVYDCPMSDGDTLAEVIHASDYIDDSVPVRPDQINQVMAICRGVATAALDAADAMPPTEMSALQQAIWTAVKNQRDAAENRLSEAEREVEHLNSLLRRMKSAGMNSHLPTLEDVQRSWTDADAR